MAAVRELQDALEAKYDIEIRRLAHNLGLKEHILSLGDLSREYGSVIVLEDDLVVDPQFHAFASACVDFYAHDETIAGHALYAQSINETAALPFVPMSNGFSTYFMRTPCSWGQCWTAKQWAAFREWFAKNKVRFKQDIRVPPNVRHWADSSWKKHFAAYLIDRDRDFTYPYRSYTSNCAATGGTHVKNETSLFQTPLASPNRRADEWRFCPTGYREVAYDAFMEPCGEFVWKALDKSPDEVSMDLYGTKPAELLKATPLTVTSRKARARDATFPLSHKPHEMNLRYPSAHQSVGGLALCDSDQVQESAPRLSRQSVEFWSGIRMNKRRIIELLASFLRSEK